MAFALNNAQGELSPLEVGLHALHSGLSQTEYGKQMGLSQPSISIRIRAAEVADITRVINADSWRHLAEIQPAPRWLWRALREALGLANVSDALGKLDDDEKMTLALTEGHFGQRGGAREINIVSESGLYALALGEVETAPALALCVKIDQSKFGSAGELLKDLEKAVGNQHTKSASP